MSDPNTNPTFVMFYTNWCGYCKKAMPNFDGLTCRDNDDINIIKINADVQNDLINQHKIEAYPTFRLYFNGMNDLNNSIDYDENYDSMYYRRTQGFIIFLQRYGFML